MDKHSTSLKPSSKATVTATGVVSTYHFVILNSLLNTKLNYEAFAYSATDVKSPSLGHQIKTPVLCEWIYDTLTSTPGIPVCDLNAGCSR